MNSTSEGSVIMVDIDDLLTAKSAACEDEQSRKSSRSTSLQLKLPARAGCSKLLKSMNRRHRSPSAEISLLCNKSSTSAEAKMIHIVASCSYSGRDLSTFDLQREVSGTLKPSWVSGHMPNADFSSPRLIAFPRCWPLLMLLSRRAEGLIACCSKFVSSRICA